MVAAYNNQHHEMPGLDTVYEWRVELDCGCVSKGREAQ
ncbi:MAG: hypothetical protein QOC62_4262 [Mycobacterium sp.]|jgi:hypothetical protein|nr:hypothetical protein [Mycobacterium sp.]